MMKVVVVLSLVSLLSSCCVSLPRMEPKRVVALPVIFPVHDVQESSAVWRDERRSRDVPVHIYMPGGAGGPFPIVIFSHGIGEDRDSYAYIGRALASNGFIAVHLTHSGTDKAVLSRGYWKLYRATKNPENWRNRPLDVSFVIDRLIARGDVDASRIAVAGHSAGAFTAFAVAGVQGANGEKMRDERVRVIVPMSMPRIPGLSYDDTRIPALNITGTCDSSIIYRTRPEHRRIPFQESHAPHQYLATIDGVNHNTFSNAEDRHHELILTLMIDFLRAYLLDDRAALAWFDDGGTAKLADEQFALERK
jgi:pimeloyl-ACP methyl ester carboxylesterase